MLIVISPAKTLKTDVRALTNSTFPLMLKYSALLVNELKKYSSGELSELMKISPKLAQLNHSRFQQWHYPYKLEEGNNALLTFRGEVYNGLEVDSFSQENLNYAQKHLIILSGLYGVLRPLDVILPYRLEMGTKISPAGYKNLYEFWSDKILNVLNNKLAESDTNILINLASQEYFKSIETKKLNAEIITPVFKENKNGVYKVVSIYAKKARGLMTRFIIKNKINNPEKLMLFDEEGYYYNEKLSDKKKGNIVFTRN